MFSVLGFTVGIVIGSLLPEDARSRLAVAMCFGLFFVELSKLIDGKLAGRKKRPPPE